MAAEGEGEGREIEEGRGPALGVLLRRKRTLRRDGLPDPTTDVNLNEPVAEEHLGPNFASHDSELASYLRIEARELEAVGLN